LQQTIISEYHISRSILKQTVNVCQRMEEWLLKQEVVMIAITRYIIYDYIILFMVHYRLFIYTKL